MCRVFSFADDSLGADAYWAAGLHLYTPLPFRPGRGGLGDHIKTHFFFNTGNLASLDTSMIYNFKFWISCCIPTRFRCAGIFGGLLRLEFLRNQPKFVKCFDTAVEEIAW